MRLYIVRNPTPFSKTGNQAKNNYQKSLTVIEFTTIPSNFNAYPSTEHRRWTTNISGDSNENRHSVASMEFEDIHSFLRHLPVRMIGTH
nr:hypothetical protein Iba_chr05bCG10470 [Ipomoea batatas]GMD31274.1 hypothetical protein Iba_scaffold43649CG0010 [Ipomoea batatas]